MFKLVAKEINEILSAQTILIWTYYMVYELSVCRISFFLFDFLDVNEHAIIIFSSFVLL